MSFFCKTRHARLSANTASPRNELGRGRGAAWHVAGNNSEERCALHQSPRRRCKDPHSPVNGLKKSTELPGFHPGHAAPAAQIPTWSAAQGEYNQSLIDTVQQNG